MKPPPFLPSRDAKNASRIMNLSRLRGAIPHGSEIDPALLDDGIELPDISVAKYALEE
jgi:hypothetical protein